jgi:N-glycosylase/DNA lyase
MKVVYENENIYIKEILDFDLEQTLECGQCFHFHKIRDNEYIVIAYNHMLHIAQKDNELCFYNTTMDDYENIWKEYFDIERDYGKIKRYLMTNDELLIPAIEAKSGIRILKQEFSETLMSFIISQTKQIPQIKQVVRTISERYGEFLGEFEGEKFYSFPNIDKLKNISREEFIECKVGFRADYLVAAANYLSDEMNEEYFKGYTYEEAKKELTAIKGVGEKVANCVLLFALGYRNAFPVDVWIKRTMEDIYFKKETPIKVIQQYADEKYGEYGGYAQQYLFFYGKSSKKEKI